MYSNALCKAVSNEVNRSCFGNGLMNYSFEKGQSHENFESLSHDFMVNFDHQLLGTSEL